MVIINRKEGIYNYDNQTNVETLNPSLKFNNSVDELIFTNDYTYSLTDQISVSAIEKNSGKIIEDEIFNKKTILY